MKNSEEAIAKVLAGLRDTEAPSGMERRILNGLEERAAVQTRSGGRWLGPVWLLACSSVVAGLFVVALAIPAIRRLAHGPAQAKMTPASVGLLPPAASAAGAKTERSAPFRSSVRSAGRESAGKETSAGEAEAAGDSDSVAMEEMHAGSQLAPPMPLTRQERLLLRLTHRGDAMDLAMLDPALLAARGAEEKAEFQRLFGRPTTGQATPGQSTAEQTALPATEQAAPEQPMTEQGVPTQQTTEQAIPAQPTTEKSVPAQPSPEQPAPEQSPQEQPKPQNIAPDQSTTQQLTPRPIRTGDSE